MPQERNPAIPIDAYRDPVLAYAAEGGEPVVAATNAAFDAEFDGAAAGSPVDAVFARFGVVESPDGDDPTTRLVPGESAVVYLDGFGEHGPYLARVVPGAGDEDDAEGTGFLVFTPLGDALGVAETAGVGQVASALGHDLRNPLDVAKANLRAARETGEPEHFDAVADAHDRMGTIIRDVLTLARGREAVTPSEGTSIGRAVDDAWQSVDTERATLETADGLPTATADADRIRRLFENLFRNAVEHTDESVTVRVGALADGFYVADDGAGVPPDERDAVFDPGYSTNEAGTGLGLAIVDRIVAAHGWELRLRGSDDGGARFEVRF
jgi:signal transduction histidine kinase